MADKCKITQHSDQTQCETCGLKWDTNDPEEPKCPSRNLYDITFYNVRTDTRKLLNADWHTAKLFVENLILNDWKNIKIRKK